MGEVVEVVEVAEVAYVAEVAESLPCLSPSEMIRSGTEDGTIA